MAQCSGCDKKTSRFEEVINCAEKECGRIFHPRCITTADGSTATAAGLPNDWTCQRCSAPKPSTASATTDEFATLVLQVAEIHRKISPIDFALMQECVKALQTKVSTLEEALCQKNAEIEEIKKQAQEDRQLFLGKINSFDPECTNVATEGQMMEKCIDEFKDRKVRENNVLLYSL